MMGMSFGLFWANRDFLALSTTNDANRNYYYGVETFFYTNTYVIVPAIIGWFIEGTGVRGWFGGDPQHRLSNRHGLRLPADDLLLDRCSSGPLREPAEVSFHLFPLSLALEPDATAGHSEGPGARLHRHRAGHARDAFGRTRGRAGNDPGRRRHPLRVPALLHRPHDQTCRTASSSSPSA